LSATTSYRVDTFWYMDSSAIDISLVNLKSSSCVTGTTTASKSTLQMDLVWRFIMSIIALYVPN
jgi:hypothetical protein